MAEVTKKLLSAKLRASLTEEDGDSDDEIRNINERIPFNRNTNNNVSRNGDINNKLCLRPQNKDKENSPKIIRSKPRRHLDRNEFDANNNSRPVTPTKETDQFDSIAPAPLTPTANLKMLFSAVSPEIRKMQDQKRQEELINESPTPEDNSIDKDDLIFSSQESDSGKAGGSRKEKSLGLLCQKFLQRYPDYPEGNIEVCLDEVARELNVERRRIYDIVNVLESVEIVSRIAKNKYAWHGKTNLVTTLGKLKMLAEKEGFGDQIQQVKEHEFYRELNTPRDIELLDKTFMRKDKSLGIMSQKFLMLFLISKPKTVNLDISAKILIGDPNIDKTENSKFKTKIRRLYDIANILTSLDLIRKVHVTEIRGRKPAFRYIGPDVDAVCDLSVCCSDGIHRPSSRHSLLDCIKNKKLANIMSPSTYVPIQPAPVISSEKKSKLNSLQQEIQSDVPKRFSRHASFDMICEAAEKERTKLYACNSEPSSPVKKLDFENMEDIPSLPASQEPLPVKKKKKIFMLKGTPAATLSPMKKNNTGVQRKQETLIIKTNNLNGTSCRQPTMIPLTQDQINAVLKSLKVPVTNIDTTRLVDACTQSSPNLPGVKSEEIVKLEQRSASPEFSMAIRNETTPSTTTDYMRGIKRGVDRIEAGMEKRIKLALPTPPSTEEESCTSSSDGSPDNEVSEINQRLNKRRGSTENGRPSPLRALHLAPEFKSCGAFKTISPPDMPADSDLALPLPEDSETKKGQSLLKSSYQHVTVQMTNHPQQFIHVPIVHIPRNSLSAQEKKHMSLMTPTSLIQSLPLNSLNQNQPMNFVVPVNTFSPPLTPVTPANSSSSPTFFTLPAASTATSIAYNLGSPTSTFSQVSNIQMVISGAQPITTNAGQYISCSTNNQATYLQSVNVPKKS
ncbi:transcription factor E2F8 [Patella vulgata]|uniref:transcription factor E2F8 n=1 Tax=Patella vulgata TaxID=6465 RepID=UPI0024A89B2C|nr:transcription factor E2F8 [Patella vulgata]